MSDPSRSGRSGAGAAPRVLYVTGGAVGEIAPRAIDRLGATPIEAVGGSDAVARVESTPVDAAVLPGSLPDVAPATVVERIGERRPDCRILVVGEAAGAIDGVVHLPADVSAAALADRVESTIDDRRIDAALDRHARLGRAAFHVLRSVDGEGGRRALEEAVRAPLVDSGLFVDGRVRRVDRGGDGSTPGAGASGDADAGGSGSDDRTLAGRALAAGEVLVEPATERSGEPPASDVAEDEDDRAGAPGRVAVPLGSGEDVDAALVLVPERGNLPDGPERELLTALGRLVGRLSSPGGRTAAERSDRSPSAGLVAALAAELRAPLDRAASGLEAVEPAEGEEDAIERATAAIGTVLDVLESLSSVTETGEVGTRAETQVHERAVRVWRAVRTPEAELTIAGPTTVDADPALLERLVETLLGVAADHGGRGTSIRVGPLPTRPGFYVENDGRGVPTPARRALCGSGVPARGAGREGRLRFAREVVEAHGWSVSIVEAPTGGARIEVLTERDAAPTSGAVDEISALFESAAADADADGRAADVASGERAEATADRTEGEGGGFVFQGDVGGR